MYYYFKEKLYIFLTIEADVIPKAIQLPDYPLFLNSNSIRFPYHYHPITPTMFLLFNQHLRWQGDLRFLIRKTTLSLWSFACTDLIPMSIMQLPWLTLFALSNK